MTAAGNMKIAGIAGWPVSHSLSPALHEYWLRHHGVNGAYLPLPVRPGRLGDAISGLKALGFAGCNITAPYKEEALLHLDALDPAAAAIGAVNTVAIGEDGRAVGMNTDAAGFLSHLDAALSWPLKGKTVTLLGAGGAARAIAWALLNGGAGQLRIVNRDRTRAERLAAALPFSNIVTMDWDSRNQALEGAGLLVNATAAGMAGVEMAEQHPLMLDLSALPPASAVYDIVYSPLETPLLAAAGRLGLKCVDGLGMLLHQAVPAFEAWFGVRPAVTGALRAHVLSVARGARPA